MSEFIDMVSMDLELHLPMRTRDRCAYDAHVFLHEAIAVIVSEEMDGRG